MGKKYRKNRDVFGYYAEEDNFESQFKDELDDMDSDDEIGNEGEISAADLDIEDILKMDVDDLEKGKKILSKEIITLQNGEERTRAIGDLKEIEAMMYARRRYERKKDQMSDEFQLKQKELEKEMELKHEQMLRDFEFKQKELEQERIRLEKELSLKKEEMIQNVEMHDEDIKVQKRSTLIGALVNTVLTFASLGAYGYLLDKQNKFESNENYSTSGSRGLTNNISRIPSIFGKH